METGRFRNNMERCRRFYRQYGAPMIHRRFPGYEGRIAVGMAGEGSDCFGYDDPVSRDHDYGIGFCMWVTEETYGQIGRELSQAYEALILEHGREYLPAQGPEDGQPVSRFLSSRRGVFTAAGFYRQLLGKWPKTEGEEAPPAPGEWLEIPEENLAAAVNGEVFRDDEGVFSRLRCLLQDYYPEPVRRIRLAEQIHGFSQNGQYNYPRMMARGDMVTARLCVAQALKSAMAAAYLLNRRYAPYYKWMRRGLEDLPRLSGMGSVLDQAALAECQQEAWKNVRYSPVRINLDDRVCSLMERLAAMLLEELRRQRLVSGQDLFLDIYCGQIAGLTAEKS